MITQKCVNDQYERNLIEQLNNIKVVLDMRLAVSNVDSIKSRNSHNSVQVFDLSGVPRKEKANNDTQSSNTEENMVEEAICSRS